MPFYTAHLSYYIEGNDSRFVSGIPDSVALIIKNNLKYWEKSIEIEYYNNSKVIKAIDGIEISDKDIIEKLGNRVRELSKKNKKDKENSIIYNSIGKNIKEVKKELEECELNYRFNSQKNDSSTKGLFLYTPPGEGVYVPKGSIVKVTINE